MPGRGGPGGGGSPGEVVAEVRKRRRVEGSSIRELADRHHVHRRTVRQALDSAVPPPRKSYPQRPRPAIDVYAAVIDGWLLADRQGARKPPDTPPRGWDRAGGPGPARRCGGGRGRRRCPRAAVR